MLGLKQCFSEANFTCVNIYCSSLLHHTVLTYHSLISQITPFAYEACETNRSLGRTENYGERLGIDSCTLFTAILQGSTCDLLTYIVFVCCVSLVWASTKKGANWWCQASHECVSEGKSGSVETWRRLWPWTRHLWYILWKLQNMGRLVWRETINL